tara:strand:- start:498 stop:707 length:210 start_codon:yes stop_codon:yes gene_type:complete
MTLEQHIERYNKAITDEDKLKAFLETYNTELLEIIIPFHKYLLDAGEIKRIIEIQTRNINNPRTYKKSL